MPSKASFSTNGLVAIGFGVDGLALLPAFRVTLDSFSESRRMEDEALDEECFSLLVLVVSPIESWDLEL
jgi:hypothetical protein